MLTPLPIRTARSGWGFLFIDMAKIGYPKPKKNGFPKSFFLIECNLLAPSLHLLSASVMIPACLVMQYDASAITVQADIILQRLIRQSC